MPQKDPGHIALKYLMCSKELSKIDAVSIKYLMCSRKAEDSIKTGGAVSIKYLMCSKEFTTIER